MIDEKEKAYYRSNITDKYVIEIDTILEAEERIKKKKYELIQRFEKLKNNPDYKRCNKCGEYKRLSEFYKNPLKKQGVFDYCKKCAIAMGKNKKKIDLGFWDKNGKYKADFQEVDFSKEGNMR